MTSLAVILRSPCGTAELADTLTVAACSRYGFTMMTSVSRTLRVAVVSTIVMAASAPLIDVSGAHAVSAPGAPIIGGGVEIISDNDYALFAGDASNVTRIIHQNNDVFWDQVAGSANVRISLHDGESYVYLLGMGGGGAEDIGGTLNGIDVTTIASGANGLQRAIGKSGGQTQDGYLLLNPGLTNWDPLSHGNCDSLTSVCWGPYVAQLSEVKAGLAGATWGNPPSVTWGQAGNAFAYPDSTAVMFRIKASALGTGMAIGSGSTATVSWAAPSSDGGSSILDYTVTAYRSSDNSNSGRSCTTANGSTRTCTVTGLSDGVSYYFKVTARNSAGAGAASSATGGVTAVDNTPPTTTTTTTTTVPATTTTVRPTTTTAAPALEIVVNAPATTAPAGQVTVPATSIPVVTNSTVALTTLKSTATPSTVAVPVMSTTTTTLPNNSGGTVAPPVPKIQVVEPGEAAVSVGDKAEAVTVERADNQVTVRAGALSATLGSIDEKGEVGALDSDGNVRLKPGDTVRIKLAGFEPGSEVEAWLFSTPVLMGRATVARDGSVIGNFMIPENAPTGAHRIAIVAKTTDGKPATLTVGVKVGNWKKESSITVWLIVLPIVLAVIGALTLPATRRRRREQSA